LCAFQSGHLEYFLFIKCFLLQECVCQGVEFTPVITQQLPCLVVTFSDDAQHLFVNCLGRILTERLACVAGRHRIVQVWIAFWRELDHPKAVAHAPPRHHSAREVCCLLDVVFGTGRARTEDDLLRGPPTENTDDPRTEVVLRIIVTVTFRPLIGDSESLTAWDDRNAIHRISTWHDESKDSVT